MTSVAAINGVSGNGLLLFDTGLLFEQKMNICQSYLNEETEIKL